MFMWVAIGAIVGLMTFAIISAMAVVGMCKPPKPPKAMDPPHYNDN